MGVWVTTEGTAYRVPSTTTDGHRPGGSNNLNNYNNNINTYYQTSYPHGGSPSTTETNNIVHTKVRWGVVSNSSRSSSTSSHREPFGVSTSSTNNNEVDVLDPDQGIPVPPTPEVWTPPPQIPHTPYPGGDTNLFDFDKPTKVVKKVDIINTGIESGIKKPKRYNNTHNLYMADSGDSTLIIIIIIAILMIIIVSILIIFFMCKRRDDPIYKMDDKQRYEFAQNAPPGAGGPGGPGGRGPGPGGSGAGGKQGVKEWYV